MFTYKVDKQGSRLFYKGRQVAGWILNPWQPPARGYAKHLQLKEVADQCKADCERYNAPGADLAALLPPFVWQRVQAIEAETKAA